MAGIEGMVISAVVKQAIRGLAAAAGSPMAKLWGSCKKDLEEMRGTLTLLEAALRDAERRSGAEEAARVWLRQLKAVAREISSALDKAPPSPWKVRCCCAITPSYSLFFLNSEWYNSEKRVKHPD
jgi:hypothetical protein